MDYTVKLIHIIRDKTREGDKWILVLFGIQYFISLINRNFRIIYTKPFYFWFTILGWFIVIIFPEFYRIHHILGYRVADTHMCRLSTSTFRIMCHTLYYIVTTQLFLSIILFLVTLPLCLVMFYGVHHYISTQNKAYFMPTS